MMARGIWTEHFRRGFLGSVTWWGGGEIWDGVGCFGRFCVYVAERLTGVIGVSCDDDADEDDAVSGDIRGEL